MATELSKFLEMIEGDWAGNETLITGPGAEQRINAEGRFSNVQSLAGKGLSSSYTQSVDGDRTMDCQTTYRFDDDGGVQMAWVPSSGDSVIFTGHWHGGQIEVERCDDNGMTHSIKTEYKNGNSATVRSAIRSENMPEMLVFSGDYTRQ